MWGLGMWISMLLCQRRVELIFCRIEPLKVLEIDPENLVMKDFCAALVYSNV